MPPWRTRKDKRKYQEREKVGVGPDSGREDDRRKELLKGLSAGRRGKAFVGKEALTPADIEKLVAFNQWLMKQRGTHFDVNRLKLERICRDLDKFRTIAKKDERLISMAAWLAYAIAKQRPFFNGNKRSGSVATVRFLNANGYDLLIELLDIEREFHEILVGVQHEVGDFDDVRNFVKKKARHL